MSTSNMSRTLFRGREGGGWRESDRVRERVVVGRERRRERAWREERERDFIERERREIVILDRREREEDEEDEEENDDERERGR